MRERVVVVEDDEGIRELVVFHLERAGFEVRPAPSGAAALDLVRAWQPQAVVLDILLPDASGLDLCQRIQAEGEVLGHPGIIMLTALAEEGDRVVGLEVGADDYVTKPFSPRELVARVRAVLRRRAPAPPAPVAPGTGGGRVGDLVVDRERLRVTVAGREVEALTATEFRLVAALCEAGGRVLSRDQLIERAWGPDFFGDDRTVDVHIRHIRGKLGRAGAADAIETVRGFGYRLRAAPRGGEPGGLKEGGTGG